MRSLSCCFKPIMRNSVLEELRVRRFADIQEEICFREYGKSGRERVSINHYQLDLSTVHWIQDIQVT